MFENLKKYLGVVLFVFIITLLFLGCMSFKTHVGNRDVKKYQEALVIDRKFKTGGRNFVFLVKETSPIMSDMCDYLPIPCEPMISSTASGLVLSSDNASIFVITAAHFCVSQEEEKIFFEESIIGFANDTPRELFPVSIDSVNDICLLIGTKMKSDNFYNIKLAQEFTPGEEVYTVAAPLSIAGPGIRMIFKGNLSGCNEEACISTIPATFGSSGGGIYNSKGELVSIVMAVPEEFSHVTLSPSNVSLTKFISDIDKVVDIYSY